MESDDQQLEELKRWWQENGRAVVLGVVLGLGSVGGYLGWQRYSNAQAEMASTLYSRMVNTRALRNHGETVTQADQLIAEFPDSSYAALAGLVAASSAYQNNDTDNAIRLLRWAESHASEPEVAHVARLRLARVLAEKADYDAALAALELVDGSSFADLVAETRGDVLVAKGDSGAARESYDQVLSSTSLDGRGRSRVQGKLDQLSAAGS